MGLFSTTGTERIRCWFQSFRDGVAAAVVMDLLDLIDPFNTTGRLVGNEFHASFNHWSCRRCNAHLALTRKGKYFDRNRVVLLCSFSLGVQITCMHHSIIQFVRMGLAGCDIPCIKASSTCWLRSGTSIHPLTAPGIGISILAEL
jgi:hypothetical protein